MNKKLVLMFGVFLVLSLVLVSAQDSAINKDSNEVKVVMFYGQGCPHCAALQSLFERLERDNNGLEVAEYEVYFNESNRELLNKVASAYGHEVEGVPTIFIGDEVIVGYNNEIAEDIVSEINQCKSSKCVDPLEKIKNGDGGIVKKLTIPAVISAAAVDAINPCAFAVLIILLTTILATKKRKRALLSGLAFSLSIFISYFLMGIGLYSAIQASGLTRSFYIFVAVLAILVGLFNLKDYFWYGKWFVMEVPLRWRPRMKMLIKGVTSVPGAFLVGFLVSLFLLPCTSGPYIVILGLLSNVATQNYATFLLIIYNFIFILPMIIITLAVYFGFTTTEKAEEWRKRKLKVLHLIAGLIILILGIGMIVALIFGWI
ncbi:hypothetical protein GF386_06815 [Candidatus Pacearchaeota archaeon]|nr:hypothetical protein [Candidatus Pacearchaeota archaeon]MBD3283792.1 hypothetical protein [Candidatus Pacearchaeota archaeon]